MIIVYAGVQADETDRVHPRLPPTCEAQLATRLRGLLDALNPRIVTGALASGSDIIIAEAALHAGCDLDVHLPYSTVEFVSSSVAPRGQLWTDRFNIVFEAASHHHIAGDYAAPERADFVAHNAALLDRAVALAEPGEKVWALTVRPPADPTASSVSDDFADRAAARQLLCLDLNPIAQRARGFVAMAYGNKFDPANKVYYNGDPVFDKVYRPLLEDLDVDWVRADLQTDSGLIHVAMIDDLANSDIVIADLATANFNVGYEIGLRHVFAPFATVLVSPSLTDSHFKSAPFDVGIQRIARFDRSSELTDDQAEVAIKKLRPVFTQALEAAKRDSPVHEWFEVDHLQAPFVRRGQLPPQVRRELEIRGKVTAAIRSSDAATMNAAARLLQEALDLPETSRTSLRIELAAGLLDEGEYQTSAALLDESEPPEDSAVHRLWLHKSAMAHRRVGDRADDFGQRNKHWRIAENLLSRALEIGYQDSETYGIFGGLLKNRLKTSFTSLPTHEADALFSLMCDQYRLGFETDPNYYLGVNLVMALRIQMRRGGTSAGTARPEFDEALTVSKFLARIAVREDPRNFWAAVTHAELLLHEALDQGCEPGPALTAYARAATLARPARRESAVNQLDFLELCGDPPEVIAPIRSTLQVRQ